jgi:hypothetical protein
MKRRKSMKFKLKGTIANISYKKGAVTMALSFAALELPNVVQILQLINNTFNITLAKKVEGKAIKLKINNVLYDGLNFGKEGSSKLKLDIESSQIPSLKDLDNFDELIVMLIESADSGDKDDKE